MHLPFRQLEAVGLRLRAQPALSRLLLDPRQVQQAQIRQQPQAAVLLPQALGRSGRLWQPLLQSLDLRLWMVGLIELAAEQARTTTRHRTMLLRVLIHLGLVSNGVCREVTAGALSLEGPAVSCGHVLEA